MTTEILNTRRKMDIQHQYLDIQLCEKHLTYSDLKSNYSLVIYKIFILTYFNLFDRKIKCPDITFQYLDITTEYEYIRCLSHS